MGCLHVWDMFAFAYVDLQSAASATGHAALSWRSFDSLLLALPTQFAVFELPVSSALEAFTLGSLGWS